MTAAVQLLLLLPALTWSGYVLARIVAENHRRGIARVHAGRSWECRCAYSRLDHADGLCERRVR